MRECYFGDYTIGSDAYENILKICSPLGRNVLIVGGKTALAKAEGKLLPALLEFRIADTVVYGDECTRKRVEELNAVYSGYEIDFIMGVGGGKAIDTAKCLADRMGKSVVTVPTIASTCAASSALAVTYTEEHIYDGFWNFKGPAYHVFIDTEIIANAPDRYFRAGVGDTLAKYYEVELSMRGEKTCFRDELGRSVSEMSRQPLMRRAARAYEDCKLHRVTEDLEETALIILISTGMVSMLINEVYNGALAHALFYGLTRIKGFEEKFLHGDVIGYTTTVQLALDNNIEESKRVRDFIKSLGIEASLKARGICTDFEYLKPCLESAIKDPDMKVIPYEITPEMIHSAILEIESMED